MRRMFLGPSRAVCRPRRLAPILRHLCRQFARAIRDQQRRRRLRGAKHHNRTADARSSPPTPSGDLLGVRRQHVSQAARAGRSAVIPLAMPRPHASGPDPSRATRTEDQRYACETLGRQMRADSSSRARVRLVSAVMAAEPRAESALERGLAGSLAIRRTVYQLLPNRLEQRRRRSTIGRLVRVLRPARQLRGSRSASRWHRRQGARGCPRPARCSVTMMQRDDHRVGQLSGCR